MLERNSISEKINSSKAKKIMERWYGKSAVKAQCARWQKLAEDTFNSFDVNEVEIISSPGRTELGGNHTDHNNGKVLCAAINQDSLACVAPNPGNIVKLYSEGWDKPFNVDLNDLEIHDEEKGTPESLIRGIAASFKKKGFNYGGFVGRMNSIVPAGSGLSSSASVEVLFGQIQNILYNDSVIQAIDIAISGREAENEYFGKPCGLMDQAACALGGISVIDFGHPEKPRWSTVNYDFEKEGYMIALTNVGTSHADLTDQYASMPTEMKKVASMFGQETLRKVSLDSLIEKSVEIREQAGDRAFLRALHFEYENTRVEKMANALECGNLKKYFKNVKKSGESSWCLLQNVIPKGGIEHQDIAVAIELSKYFIGKDGAVRIHGGGLAGTIQTYVKNEMAEDFCMFMNKRFGENSTTLIQIRPDGVGKASL